MAAPAAAPSGGPASTCGPGPQARLYWRAGIPPIPAGPESPIHRDLPGLHSPQVRLTPPARGLPAWPRSRLGTSSSGSRSELELERNLSGAPALLNA